MKLILLIVLSCMVAQSISWGRFRLPRIPAPRIRIPVPRLRIPKIPLPRVRIPGVSIPILGKRDASLADDADSDVQLEDAEMSFADLARLLRELPEYDENARSVDDFSMIEHDSQEQE